MLLKTWFEKKNKIFISILLTLLVVCIAVFILQKSERSEFSDCIWDITILTPMVAILLSRFVDCLEKINVYEDRIEIAGIIRIKRQIYFSKIGRITVTEKSHKGIICIYPNNCYDEYRQRILFKYNAETWLLIKKQLIACNSNPPIDQNVVSAHINTKSAGWFMLSCAMLPIWLSVNIFLNIEKTTDWWIAFFSLIMPVAAILIGLLLITDQLKIDSEKILSRNIFRNTCITKADLKEVRIIDTHNANPHARYIVCIIPQTVSDDELQERDTKILEKKLRKDKRVVVLFYSDDLATCLTTCGWTTKI